MIKIFIDLNYASWLLINTKRSPDPKAYALRQTHCQDNGQVSGFRN